MTGGLLLLMALAPVVGNPVCLWRAAQGTVCQVTARAESFYQTVRFVYCAQVRSEHSQAAK